MHPDRNTIAKRARTKNRMQTIIQHRRILRELEGIQAKFSFKKCVLRTPAVLETVLGKSSAIPICLSESCLSHDVTRALCYCAVVARAPSLLVCFCYMIV